MTKKRRYIGLVLLGLCIILGSGAVGAVKVSHAFGSGKPHDLPGQFREALASGRWDFYELTAISRGTVFYSATREHAAGLEASMIVVTAPDGQQLPVRDLSANSRETLQRGSSTYAGVAHFDAPSSGTYAIAVHGPGAERVVVARPVVSDIVGLLPWLGGALAGAVCFLLGLILVIVEYRRSSVAATSG